MKYSLDHYEKEQSDDPIRDARKVTDDFFRDNDHNQDGVISFDEFPGPKRDELWNRTANDVINLLELLSSWSVRFYVLCIDDFYWNKCFYQFE